MADYVGNADAQVGLGAGEIFEVIKELDFTAETPADLSGGGTWADSDGDTWNILNHGAATTFSVNATNGLRFDPTGAVAMYQTTRTAPALQIPFSEFATLAQDDEIALQVEIGGTMATAFDKVMAGVEEYVGGTTWYHHHIGIGNRSGARVIYHQGGPMACYDVPVGHASGDMLECLFPAPEAVIVDSLSAWAGSWPTLRGGTRLCASGLGGAGEAFINGPWIDWSAATASLIFWAGQNGSGSPSVYIKRFRLLRRVAAP